MTDPIWERLPRIRRATIVEISFLGCGAHYLVLKQYPEVQGQLNPHPDVLNPLFESLPVGRRRSKSGLTPDPEE
jgi:hypothetical protein